MLGVERLRFGARSSSMLVAAAAVAAEWLASAATVDAALRKEPLVVPGALNKVWLHVASPLLPRHLKLTLVNALWSVGSIKP